MKAEIVGDASKEEKYPCIKISDLDGVILFIAPGTGTLLHAGRGKADKLGEYSIHWDESRCRSFDGSITLSND